MKIAIDLDGGREWTQMASRVRYRHEPIPAGKNISYPQDKTMSSESEMMVEPPIRVTPPVIEQDTYLDNEIGTAMCGAKAKFGKPHFIEAYQRMLKTSKKLDDEWEKYLEEEADW